MIIFYQPRIREGARFLDPDESRHCAKVLRRKAGDAIRLTDGQGTFYDAVITLSDSRRCEFEITREEREDRASYRVHIAVAPTRNIERTEWFVEKAVEIGIDIISFIECDHSERANIKPERLHKIAVSAMKQSLRATLPEIRALVPFNQVVATAKEDQRFIAVAIHDTTQHLMKTTPGKSSCVLIGPEGDFSGAEVDQALKAGFMAVTLGSHRLRTETAALAATHILQLVNL